MKDADLSGVFATIEKIQGERGDKRERNRELMALHMPDCLRLIDQLKEAGMLGKVCSFEIYEQRKAA
jgi:hypothetical protein